MNESVTDEPVAVLRHRGTRAVQRMVEFAPSTGGLALWVRHADLHGDAGAAAPPASTDGRTIFYGAAFDALTVEAQAGWIAHEVLHVALRHAQRFAALRLRLGDADAELFNLCADAIVDGTLSHLTWLQLSPTAVRLDGLLAGVLGIEQSLEAALLEWDVERLYRAIDDRLPPAARQHRRSSSPDARDDDEPAAQRQDGPRAQRARALAAGGVKDLRPSADLGADPGVAPEDEELLAREWGERLLRAHAGDGEHSMLRSLLADLRRPRTPWEQVLRTQLARALARQPGPSWSRPTRSYIANQGRAGKHRRMPWEPGTSMLRAVPRLVVVVDVSGSIEAPLLDRFAQEIEALSRRLEARLVLVVGDERVERVDLFEPGRSDLRAIAFHGGGGTDFTPLLEEADGHRPDAIVVLTDLQGPARFRPRGAVIWAVPEAHADAVPPFGRVLVLA